MEINNKYNILQMAKYVVNISYKYSWQHYYLSGEK